MTKLGSPPCFSFSFSKMDKPDLRTSPPMVKSPTAVTTISTLPSAVAISTPCKGTSSEIGSSVPLSVIVWSSRDANVGGGANVCSVSDRDTSVSCSARARGAAKSTRINMNMRLRHDLFTTLLLKYSQKSSDPTECLHQFILIGSITATDEALSA